MAVKSQKAMVDNVHGGKPHGKCHRDYTNPATGGVKGEKRAGVDVGFGDILINIGYRSRSQAIERTRQTPSEARANLVRKDQRNVARQSLMATSGPDEWPSLLPQGKADRIRLIARPGIIEI